MGEPTQVNDNYAQFIARLDTATENLSNRRQSLNKSLAILTLLADQNRAGLEAWVQRRTNTSKLLAEHSQGPETDSLRELLEVALRMEPMFRNRTERIGQRLALLRKRSDELTKSLMELEKSKVKLDSSRMLAQERDNLSRAVAKLAGTPEGSVGGLSDAGILDDLKKAREAIVLAEALLEVKGK
ncbi:hypothetical protein [Arthrobacter sp. ES3-54]|uniref:hypothetical protein n=1 Tax=Arthrobacter sp. ES3-54 TaxID=1502991 RepID=UPI0024075813|nr:hypothetical protein [Arthrobacter sp. ES3-54]MDF9751583.1 prefoldin subunit 5 [Arthrobacter sp. ES3-54]